MVLQDVSFIDFLQKHDFDHFDLIPFKRLCCEILFSKFVYFLLYRITWSQQIIYHMQPWFNPSIELLD